MDPESAAIILLGFTIDPFWIGVAGSVAVELVVAGGHYDKDTFPPKYKKVGFYIVRIGLAFLGGVLVVVYDIASAPAAFQIGASASAVVLALARKEEVPGQAGGAAS